MTQCIRFFTTTGYDLDSKYFFIEKISINSINFLKKQIIFNGTKLVLLLTLAIYF